MIIIIDSYYPFGGGEPFLNNEIDVLAKLNEQVVIFPIDSKADDHPAFELPSNIKYSNILSQRNKLTTFFSYVQAVFDPMFWSDVLLILKQGVTLKKFAAALFYCEKTKRIYRSIYNELRQRVSSDEQIIFYSYWMHIHACVAAKLKQKYKNSVFISRAHGYDLYEFRASTKFLPGRKLIFDSADKIYSVSAEGVKYLQNHYVNTDNKLFSVSYLGTNEQGLNPYNNSIFRIVSCSNVVAVKRIDRLIDALACITDIHIEWTHYGNGDLMDSLKDRATQLLSANIQFRFAGCVANSELMKIYGTYPVSLFVNVSDSEGLPVSIMEVMSFGIPVLATDVGGTREIIDDGINGILVDRNVSSQELANQIRWMSEMDVNKIDAMRKAARYTWENKFNADINYRKFYQEIKKLG